MNMTFTGGELEYRVLKQPLAALDVNLLRQTAGLPVVTDGDRPGTVS